VKIVEEARLRAEKEEIERREEEKREAVERLLRENEVSVMQNFVSLLIIA